MRVVLVYLGRKGGGPAYSLEIAKQLRRQADLFAVISALSENADKWEAEGIQCLKVKTYNGMLSFIISSLKIFQFLKIRKKIKEFNPDIIYYPFFHPWLLFLNRLLPKIPKVYTCHDPVLHAGENNIITSFLQNKIIRESSRVIILSEIFKEKLLERGVKEENIDVVPHGIFDYYWQYDHNLKRTSHPPTLLFFGRITPYKGLENLLIAFLDIKKKINQVRLLIVGEGDLTPYRKYLDQEGIAVFNQWIPEADVANYFENVDLVVCPYTTATQSGVIPIAYAAKLPVIATNVGGLANQVSDGITGRLVAPANTQELVKACVDLMKDEPKRRQMGENGYELARTKWGWGRVGELVLQSLTKAQKKI